jgi:hypothetical protein
MLPAEYLRLSTAWRLSRVRRRQRSVGRREGAALLVESNLGGTAIGTGINGHPDYSAIACEPAADRRRPRRPGRRLDRGDPGPRGLRPGIGDPEAVVVKLSKTCNDLCLTSSGASTGLFEINLPPAQAGSSASGTLRPGATSCARAGRHAELSPGDHDLGDRSEPRVTATRATVAYASRRSPMVDRSEASVTVVVTTVMCGSRPSTGDGRSPIDPRGTGSFPR